MAEISELLLEAGRSGVELGLFLLLPVMVVMLTLMRLLESWGVLAWIARRAAPLLGPFGVPGLGVFAMLQSLLVSFAAPVATLAMMDRNGTSPRHVAATLAMVLTLAQANVVFPMAAAGLDVALVLGLSVPGGLIAAAAVWYGFGRGLSKEPTTSAGAGSGAVGEEDAPSGWFEVVQRAGREAVEIAFSAIPMIILALVAVYTLREVGAVELLDTAIGPALLALGLDPGLILPLLTKYVAGGTAMMGVTLDLLDAGATTIEAVNRAGGLLVHPFDLLGVAVLMAAGPRVAAVARVAVCGAAVGVLFRALAHLMLY